MSLKDGMAAIYLEMPDRVPRTEYSAHTHWELVKRVTGIDVNSKSTEEIQQKASVQFLKQWNYDFFWNTLIHTQVLEKCRTKMGHAVYAADGTDYDTNIYCPFHTPEEVLHFNPWETYGTIDTSKVISDFNDNYKMLQNLNDDMVNMTGIYITCISGLLEIFGWDMFLMALGTDPVAFGNVTNQYAEWIQQYFDALAQSDAPVVMVHDDIVWTSGPFVQPEWYRNYVFPNYKKYFAPLKEAGKKILFTSDGTYNQFIDDIADCGVDGFVMEPTTDMAYIAEKYGKTHVFVGNADTRVLLNGSKEDIYNEVKRCMDIGKNCPGFIMAVGNHIPPNTPVENALYYNEVYEKLSKR